MATEGDCARAQHPQRNLGLRANRPLPVRMEGWGVSPQSFPGVTGSPVSLAVGELAAQAEGQVAAQRGAHPGERGQLKHPGPSSHCPGIMALVCVHRWGWTGMPGPHPCPPRLWAPKRPSRDLGAPLPPGPSAVPGGWKILSAHVRKKGGGDTSSEPSTAAHVADGTSRKTVGRLPRPSVSPRGFWKWE